MGDVPDTRRMRPLPVYRRILLTRMKFIGDVVLTTPAVRSVRNAYPGAYVAYLGEKQAVSLLEGNPCLDEIIPYDFTRPAFPEGWRVARLLRRRRFDLVVDLFGNPRSALLTFLTGASVRVGPDRKGRGRLYTVRVRDDGVPKTAIAFHDQSLRAAGIPVSARETELFPSERERETARLFLAGGDPAIDSSLPVAALHPGATWPAKRWPAERFALLAAHLKDQGLQVLFTAGPRDGETLERVRAATHVPVRVLAAASLRELAAALSLCRVVVSNDAGPMHIAVAVGTPTVGLFGPGEERIWFPYDGARGHRALRKDVPCHPCHLDLCNRPGAGYMECMHLLGVEDVVRGVEGALRTERSSH